mmetsp:Transcript_17080/g.50496  ORF Transcript_17080/g.50496 Transcript_17080/m.50496 type:complete len:242 (-) Transcript_17080:848-1573(-)
MLRLLSKMARRVAPSTSATTTSSKNGSILRMSSLRIGPAGRLSRIAPALWNARSTGWSMDDAYHASASAARSFAAHSLTQQPHARVSAVDWPRHTHGSPARKSSPLMGAVVRPVTVPRRSTTTSWSSSSRFLAAGSSAASQSSSRRDASTCVKPPGPPPWTVSFAKAAPCRSASVITSAVRPPAQSRRHATSTASIVEKKLRTSIPPVMTTSMSSNSLTRRSMASVQVSTPKSASSASGTP